MAGRPRFEGRGRTRVITAEQFQKGFWVYANGKQMHVGYLRIATTDTGMFIVKEPEWVEAFE